MRLVQVTNATRQSVIGSRIRLAATQRTRLFGLLGTNGLNEGEGLWIRPSSGVHTFGMSYSIDVIGLDRQKRVVKLWQDLRPQRVTSLSPHVKSVLELPAGTIARTGARVGDDISILVQPEE